MAKQPRPWLTRLRFRRVVVDEDNPRDPHCKAAGDLDGDGCPDLLAASARDGGLFWYRWPAWTKHRIADGSFTTDMQTADLDGDGHVDVIVPSPEGLMCYRNPRGRGGDPATDPWEAVNLSPDGAQMHDIRVADLNGDGRPDLVTRHQSGFGRKRGNAVHLWLQDGAGAWAHRTFDCPHGEGLEVADLDGDGRPDIAIGGRWYRHPGDALGGTWTEHLYMSAERFDAAWTAGDVRVAAGDLNGDGRPELVLTPSEGQGLLAWYAAGADAAAPWAESVIESQLDHAHGLALGDMDGDGHLDVVVAKMHQATPPQEVRVYRNQGRGDGWLKEVASRRGSHNIVLVDVGATGRLGIFGANWNDASPTGGALELFVNEE